MAADDDAPDGDHRPTVVTIDVGASAGMGGALQGLEEACRSRGRFGVLVDARGVSSDPDQQGRRVHVRRLRALRPQMKEHCLGVAFVTAPEELAAQRKRVRAARLMLGCSVDAPARPRPRPHMASAPPRRAMAGYSNDAAWSWLVERGAGPESEIQP